MPVELDLTPGVAVADRVVQRIDTDRDGALSIEEQQTYARQVLSSVALRIDGTPLQLTLVASHFPDVDAVRGPPRANQSPAISAVRFPAD